MEGPALVFMIVLALAGIVFGPLAVIWALNTLFALSIPVTVWTWMAVVVLVGVFGR
jgi:hypothetical protein